MLDGIDRADYARRTISEIGEKVYTEQTPAHAQLLEKLAIQELAEQLFSLARNRLGYRGTIDNQYHIARHVAPAHRTEKFRTHYDSHLFTIVMPLQLPDNLDAETDRGQLYFAPLHRAVPANDFVNSAQKLIAKRHASRRGYEAGLKNGLFMEEDFSDGQALLFLGKQTLHGNCNVGALANRSRLTVLAHFFDDGSKSGVGNVMRVLRAR